MIVFTSPVMHPIAPNAGLDLNRFGIFGVLLVEIALITPPIGFNLFGCTAQWDDSCRSSPQPAFPFLVIMLPALVVTILPSIPPILPDIL